VHGGTERARHRRRRQARFDALELHGLPFTFVGSRTVLGNPGAIRKLVEQAMEGDRPALPVAWMVALAVTIALALGALTARTLRTVRAERRETTPTTATG
jgi:hypothetical protein